MIPSDWPVGENRYFTHRPRLMGGPGSGENVETSKGLFTTVEVLLRSVAPNKAANTALAVWFLLLGSAMAWLASLPGPFYPRHSKPGAKPIPLWKARAFAIALALWALFGAVWMWRYR